MAQLFPNNSRRNLRITLFVIILATLPFYCIGFILWAAAPQVASNAAVTRTATLPPASREPTSTLLPTSDQPGFITSTPLPLQPTPVQFFTPGGGNIFPTPILPATITPPPVFIPTSTTAPSLTPIPLPTSTPIPQPTNTQIPPPTNTEVPPPTNTEIPAPTSTTIPIFPTDTETPINAEAQEFSAEAAEQTQENAP